MLLASVPQATDPLLLSRPFTLNIQKPIRVTDQPAEKLERPAQPSHSELQAEPPRFALPTPIPKIHSALPVYSHRGIALSRPYLLFLVSPLIAPVAADNVQGVLPGPAESLSWASSASTELYMITLLSLRGSYRSPRVTCYTSSNKAPRMTGGRSRRRPAQRMRRSPTAWSRALISSR